MKKNIFFLFILYLISACTQYQEKIDSKIPTFPSIFPDYIGVTVPFNIAPLNFSAYSSEEEILSAHFESPKSQLSIKSKKGFISIPIEKWKKLLM